MKKTITTLGIAGLSLLPAQGTGNTTEINKTKEEVAAILQAKTPADTISLENVKNLQLSREEVKQIIEEELLQNEPFRNEVEKLQKKYGRASVSKELLEFIITISRNPEHFGSFDSEGNYTADEEKIMTALKQGGMSEKTSQDYKAGITVLLGGISLFISAIMLRNTLKEGTKRKKTRKPQL